MEDITLFKKKVMLIAIFLVCLLAISAVSANEDVGNDIITSDMYDSALESNEMSDVSIESANNDLISEMEDSDDVLESADDDLIFEEEEDADDVFKSADDDIYSNIDEDAWYNDRIIWYDGEWDNVKFASFEFVDNLENPENITILLSCDDKPIANVDLAFSNDYDNKLTKLTTDSDGIAVYNIPFNVKQFSFCVGFWYDENNMTSCVDIGQTMIYSFALETWNNTNWDDKTEYGNSSNVANHTFSNGTFSALQYMIDNVSEGSTITLEEDYKIDRDFYYDGTRYNWNGIIISKRLTIDGKGHTIRGDGEAGTSNIFSITTDNPVTLKNIIFSHGSRAVTAVSNLKIINCTFIDNAILVDDGGAIYCSGKLTVEYSNFTGNGAFYIGDDNSYSFRGGAIICGEGSTIFYTIFDDNTANRGSAVSGFNPGDVTLTRCQFYKNYGYRNGALNPVNIIINNGNAEFCKFIDYKSSDNIVNGNVSSYIFTADYNQTIRGLEDIIDNAPEGSVVNLENDYYFDEDNDFFDYADVTKDITINGNGHIISGGFRIVGCNVVLNNIKFHYEDWGSLISAENANLTLTNCYVNSYGGAIFGSYSTLNVDNCIFYNNTHLGSGGAISWSYGNAIVSNSVFTNNRADHSGGAIYCDGRVEIYNCNFTSNDASYSWSNGGAVACGKGSIIRNSRFINNRATGATTDSKGGAVYGFEYGDVTLYDCYLEDNEAVLGQDLCNAKAVNCVFNRHHFTEGRNSVYNCSVVYYAYLKSSGVSKYYGTANKLIVNLKDDKGKAIANVNVNVVLKGVSKNIKTDSNGRATLAIGLAPGTYYAKITYPGAEGISSKIVVKKATPKITAKAKTFKKSVKTKKYSITLKVNNKAMKNTKVTIKVNKKTYSAKTNSKGVATFKITKLTKKGKYTATVKYAGSKYYNAKSVNVKITVK